MFVYCIRAIVVASWRGLNPDIELCSGGVAILRDTKRSSALCMVHLYLVFVQLHFWLLCLRRRDATHSCKGCVSANSGFSRSSAAGNTRIKWSQVMKISIFTGSVRNLHYGITTGDLGSRICEGNPLLSPIHINHLFWVCGYHGSIYIRF